MKNILFTISILAIALLSACQSGNQDEAMEEKTKAEIMAVHDEVMPRMSEMQRLKKKLQTLAASEMVADSAAVQAIFETTRFLEDADEGMMSWMSEFKQPASMRNTKSHEEIMAYLEDQKGEIEKVKKDMEGSIEKATLLLQSYSKAE